MNWTPLSGIDSYVEGSRKVRSPLRRRERPCHYFMDEHGCLIGPFQTESERDRICHEYWEDVAKRQQYEI